jgi:hypothetical protein
MEHLVPEQMFSTEENPAEGISAVKALAIASAEGQKVYTIDNLNLSTALSAIQLGDETEDEIRNAVLAGNVVSTHQYQINFNGWIGEGYIILDPDTGSGAYKIGGGSNGSWLVIVLAGLAGFFDGLAKFKDHWFNAGNAPAYAKIGGFLTVVAAIITVAQLVVDPDLSTSEKIAQIILNMGAAILALAISQWVMASAFFAGAAPIFLGLFLATIAIALSILVIEITLYLFARYQVVGTRERFA